MHYPIRSGNTAAERKQSSCFGVAGDKTRMSLRFWYAACFVSVVARRTIDLQRNKTIAVETEHSTVEVTVVNVRRVTQVRWSFWTSKG